MGTSYVTYKEFGFWSRDRYISEWLELLLEEMAVPTKNELWLNALAEEWRIQADIDGGCISLKLDEFLADDSKRALILDLAQRALSRSAGISKRAGELFIALLSGKLTTNASSPIDYF